MLWDISHILQSNFLLVFSEGDNVRKSGDNDDVDNTRDNVVCIRDDYDDDDDDGDIRMGAIIIYAPLEIGRASCGA